MQKRDEKNPRAGVFVGGESVVSLCLLDVEEQFTQKLTNAVRWIQSPLHYVHENSNYKRKLSERKEYCSEEELQGRVRGGEIVVRVIMPPNSVDTYTKV